MKELFVKLLKRLYQHNQTVA